MIYTVTFNPSLDYIVEVNDLKSGATNRTCYEELFVGGKGINVSFVLNNLRYDSTALGFLAGFTGNEIKRRLENSQIKTDFIDLDDGISRINIKIRNIEGTELNGMGPNVPEEKVQELLEKIERLKDGDVLILAGSIPKTIPATIYMDILQAISMKEILTLVDASGDLLMNVLKYKPFLIKPNRHELEELFNTEINSKDDVVPYAQELRKLGAQNVLVSMGNLGAVLVTNSGEVFMENAPHGKVVNTVGAGDSMVAGFLAGWLEKHDYKYAFEMGLSAGSATAFSEKLATRREIEDIYWDNFS